MKHSRGYYSGDQFIEVQDTPTSKEYLSFEFDHWEREEEERIQRERQERARGVYSVVAKRAGEQGKVRRNRRDYYDKLRSEGLSEARAKLASGLTKGSRYALRVWHDVSVCRWCR
jgi:hypothetical protein